jgi:hypothetical protein
VTHSSIRRTGLRLKSVVRTGIGEPRYAQGPGEGHTSTAEPAAGSDRNNARWSYFIGTRQTKNQYEKAIKPSMNKTENQFSTVNSVSWLGTPRQERAPQASQYPSSSVATVRHSRHSFGISWIMPEATRVSYSQ